MRHLKVSLSLGLVLFAGCTNLIFGDIRPVADKSKNYQIIDLSKTYSGTWIKMHTGSEDPTTGESSRADVTYRSRESGSTISVSSSCRKYASKDRNRTLKRLTRELLLGISNVATWDENERQVAGETGLETTVFGTLESDEVALRVVVVEQKTCVFDLMYVSTPKTFKSDLSAFEKFVDSLRISQ